MKTGKCGWPENTGILHDPLSISHNALFIGRLNSYIHTITPAELFVNNFATIKRQFTINIILPSLMKGKVLKHANTTYVTAQGSDMVTRFYRSGDAKAVTHIVFTERFFKFED